MKLVEFVRCPLANLYKNMLHKVRVFAKDERMTKQQRVLLVSRKIEEVNEVYWRARNARRNLPLITLFSLSPPFYRL